MRNSGERQARNGIPGELHLYASLSGDGVSTIPSRCVEPGVSEKKSFLTRAHTDLVEHRTPPSRSLLLLRMFTMLSFACSEQTPSPCTFHAVRRLLVAIGMAASLVALDIHPCLLLLCLSAELRHLVTVPSVVAAACCN